VRDDEPELVSRAQALRRSFDAGFAEPPAAPGQDVEDLLLLRVGGDAQAVRLADVSGLLVDRRIVALPTSVPDLLGVAGLRGNLLPVWSLSTLLGYGAERATPRWLLLVGDGERRPLLGLAFEHFDGHLRVARADLSARGDVSADGAASGEARRGHLNESVRVGDAWRGVLSLASLTEEIQRRVGAEERKGESTGERTGEHNDERRDGTKNR
jgi:chemotaxis signal transduction protein